MNRVLISFLVLLFTLRALAPAMMPLVQPASEAGLQLVICTASGSKTITLAPDGGSLPAEPRPHDLADCPFCAAAHAVALAATCPTVPEIVRYAAVRYAQLEAVSLTISRPKGRSARGPPPVQA